MKTTFKGKKITGILSILPENEYFFDDEVDNYSFPPAQTMRLKKIMGFNKHRISKPESTCSDFCVYGLNYLFERDLLKREEIGAIVTVSLCPDYYVPHIGNIIQEKCDLPKEIVSIDIAQGCCGFLLGLSQAFMLLDHLEERKKVLVFNTDILSHKVSKQDRNDFPLIGDATTITVVENSLKQEDIYYTAYNDGKRGKALIIPAGGFACPSNEETAELKPTGDGNFRALNHMRMDGTAVFQFVQEEVPLLLEEILKDSSNTVEDIEYFLLHQPNKFMLKKLCDKANIPYEKAPMNIVENFGNPSGSSIPLNMCFNIKDELLEKPMKLCLSAFGSGLAWHAMILNTEKLDFCEIIESNL